MLIENEPCVLFFDECDGLLGKRKDRLDETSIRVKNKFLTKFQQLTDSTLDCLVFCTTNR